MDGDKKMKDNIIWWILGIIIGYIFLTGVSSLAEKIKFLISNNFLFVLIIIIVGVIFMQKWQK